MGWFGRKKEPTPPAPRPPVKIHRDVVRLFCASARSQHPKEFAGVLRAEKGVISEILMLPGTVSGDTHAIFQLHMLPIDFNVRGTVHSHPSNNPNPSQADRELFSRFGRTHVIVAAPYTDSSWRMYDGRGDPIAYEVVD